MEKRDQDFLEAGKRGIPMTQFPDQRAQDFYEAGQKGLTVQEPAALDPTSVALNTAKGVAKTATQTIESEAGLLSKMVSGAGRSQYPDMPEITEAGIGFFESAIPNLKLGLTMDPNEKAGIIGDHFKDDQRFGGVYADEQGNPIVEWEGSPYYVNKPGLSAQDGNDILAQGVQFLPASRAAAGARSIGGRVAAALPSYAATDIAQQAGTIASGGKENIDLGQSGVTAGIGATVEGLAPPVLKSASRAGRSALEAGRKAIFPRYVPKQATPSNISIPLTEGQRTKDINLVRREEAARQGGYGDTASDILNRFDDRQLDAIRSQADELQPGHTGFDTSAPTDIGERLQTRLIDEKSSRKSAVNSAYDDAANLSKSNPARITREGIYEIADEILKVPQEMHIVREQLAQMPLLRTALDRAKTFKNMAQNERFKPQNFARIEGVRKSLNNLYKDAPKGSTEETAIRNVIAKLDTWTDEAITRGMMDGDPDTIEAIKWARSTAKKYFADFGKGKGADPSGSTMMKLLDEKQASPIQVINFITGAGKVRASAQSIGLVKRIKSIFGESSEEVALLKDAFLMKAFTGVSRGERNVTREAIVKGGRELIQGDGKALASELFTSDELKRISKLINETAFTITPADARNPSRSAYTMMQLFRDNNLLSFLGRGVRSLPLGAEVGGALVEGGGGVTARGMVNQLDRLTSMPLVTAGAAASGLQAYEARNDLSDHHSEPTSPR